MSEPSPKFVKLRAAADAASIRTASYDGVEHLVVPLVAMVANRAMRPLGSEDWELVPAEVLALAPSAWNRCAIIEDHPILDGNPVSANEPEILERESFGQVFHSKFEAGRLKMEAYINPERAVRAGRKAESVVARIRALAAGESEELVEVSVGAFVVLEKREGIDETGQRYGMVWKSALPDHLAIGLGGSRGACSVAGGCGAPRSSKEEEPIKTAVLRAAVLSQARRPTFSGTETSAWSAPSWADYVRHLHEGREGPGSVGQASAALKREVAAHSLLGDPDGSNLASLTMFPVVNPANGKLNERALRAVLGGRGAQADIPEGARTSARDMARRLLNSEFGAELEVSKMSKEAKQRAASEGLSSRDLEERLQQAVEDATAVGFKWIYILDVYPGTFVYDIHYEDGPRDTFERAYTVTDDGSVSVDREAFPVVRETQYRRVEVPPPAEFGDIKLSNQAAHRSALPAMLARVLKALGFRTAEDGTSDVDLRERMWKALNGSVPGFVDIAEIFPETKTVIYSTRPEEMLMWWRRTYEMFESVITLNDDAEQVEIEQTWKPVAAKGQPGEQATLEFQQSAEAGNPADCGCNGNGRAAPSQSTEGGPMTQVEEIVGRLIANARCPYDDKDKAHLGSLSEEKLKALDAAFSEQPAAEPEPAKDPPKATEASPPAEQKVEGEKAEPPAEGIVHLKKAEHDRLIAAAEAWEAAEVQRKAEEEKRKTALVAQLTGAQKVYSEGQLKAMSLEALRSTAKLIEVYEPEPDYSGRALASASEPTNHAPPDPYAAQLTAMRKERGLPVGKEAN